jgi:hypothetical protein
MDESVIQLEGYRCVVSMDEWMRAAQERPWYTQVCYEVTESLGDGLREIKEYLGKEPSLLCITASQNQGETSYVIRYFDE